MGVSGRAGRDHAIVIGASMGGLLAARVLADHFRAVTVLEGDAKPEGVQARTGVPHGEQTHVLLPGGARVLDRLFPGRSEELVRDGSKRFDYGGSRFHLIGNWMPRVETGLFSLAQTRPFLEEHLRCWVARIPNVRILYKTSANALLFDGGSVVGVTLQPGRDLRADLVIDAAGRNTRLPRWLAEHGCGTAPETHIGIGLGYTSARFRVPDRLAPDHPILYVVGRPPDQTRLGSVVSVEDGLVTGAVGGYHGDHPPGDLAGFLEFARSLHQPHVFDILSRAEPVSPLVRFRHPASVRRHYGKLPGFPEGLLAIGDAVCCFDPAFGQGMTVSAMEAEVLADCLARGAPLAGYWKRIDRVISAAWALSCGENLKYPQTTGRRPLEYHLTRAYRDRLATCGDPYVTREFYRVLTLTAHPSILLRPGVVWRLVRNTPPVRS
ncbi:Hydroxylase [Candidatus Sulfopaludibacter sp. SbA4]|nr:Hydroxylase [Candidatus Sulfopaludibacter sp. SbA4]